MKNYINGVLYGIKMSVKIISRVGNVQKSISELCKLQQDLKNAPIDNIKLWQDIEFNILNKYKNK